MDEAKFIFVSSALTLITIFVLMVEIILRFYFPELIWAGRAALFCAAAVVAFFLFSLVSCYNNLRENIKRKKVLLGRPGNMAHYQSAKREMERFKRTHPKILVKIVEFLAKQ